MNFGLIGQSLEHSFSKSYFENKFKVENKLNFQYQNYDIDTLDSIIQLIKQHQLKGLNITKPYKESIIPFLNHIDIEAKEIGAVNCVKITWEETQPILHGYNTDYYGFGQSIKPFLEPRHQKALILGTGGASKAVEYVLKKLNINYKYVSRTANNGIISYQDINEATINAHHIIINTTPLGMYPNIDAAPEIPYQYISDKHLLYDLVYNPEETLFLKKGKEKNAQTKNGLEMLYLQAERSWQIWNE